MATYGWVTDAEADTYFLTRLGASKWWNDAAVANKGPALQTAYNQLTLFGGFSYPAVATDKMKTAQYEQALFLLQQGNAIDMRLGLQAQGVTEAAKVGEKYSGKTGLALAPAVQALLEEYADPINPGIYMPNIERDRSEEACARGGIYRHT